MDSERLAAILESVKTGKLTTQEALEELTILPFRNLPFARIDSHRTLRRGFPEVIFGEAKEPYQIAAMVKALKEDKAPVLVTMLSEEKWKALEQEIPDGQYNRMARTLFIPGEERKNAEKGTILVITAGTSDIPVGEEAAVTAEAFGNVVERLYDVGVAGIHRLFDDVEKIRRARVLIVVAGMEGALASVVAGMVSVPVIGVPTSVGYGASFGGLTALLGMLNACSSGVAVVNIDNGFGAAVMATLINRL